MTHFITQNVFLALQLAEANRARSALLNDLLYSNDSLPLF